MKLQELRDDFNCYIERWLDYYKQQGHRLTLYTKDLIIEKGRTKYEAVYLDTYTNEKIYIIKQYA